MKKLKSILVIVMSFTMVASLFVGCSKGEEKKDAAKSSGKEITFMIPEWGAPSQEMLNEFEKESSIKVKVNTVSWDDIRDKISVSAAGKTAPADVVEVDWSWVGEFQSAGWLEPLKISKEDIEDMPSIQSFMVNDEVLAVPYANDFRIAYYNTEHFKKAGIDAEPKTWDDIYNYSKKIKEDNVTKYPYAIPLSAEESTTTSLIWLAFAKNGVVFNDDNTLNKESVLDALKYIDKLNKEGLVDPINRTSKGMDAYRKLTKGEASMLIGPTSFVGRVNDPKESQVVDKVTPIMLPGKSDKSDKTMALPEGIGVTKYSKNKEAAEEFVKWYTSAKMQEQLFEKNNSIPTRTTVLEKLIKENKIKNSGAMLEQSKLIKSPFPKGVPNYYTEMSTAMFNAVNKMVNGELTPEEAYNQMETKINELAKK